MDCFASRNGCPISIPCLQPDETKAASAEKSAHPPKGLFVAPKFFLGLNRNQASSFHGGIPRTNAEAIVCCGSGLKL